MISPKQIETLNRANGEDENAEKTEKKMPVQIECQIVIEDDGSVALIIHGAGLPEREFAGGLICHEVITAASIAEAARYLALRDYAQAGGESRYVD